MRAVAHHFSNDATSYTRARSIQDQFAVLRNGKNEFGLSDIYNAAEQSSATFTTVITTAIDRIQRYVYKSQEKP